jgi:DNA polymerase III sliding clamp (beta) subunit (PCNA family)
MGVILTRFSQKDASDGFGYVEITIFDGIARFKTSNPMQTATVTYLVDSDKDGIVYVESSRFLKLAKSFSGIVTIELKANTLFIKQGKSKYSIQIANDPMANFLTPLDNTPIEIDFGDMMNKLSFAVDSGADNCLGYYWFNDNAIAASNQYTLCESILSKSTGLVSCIPQASIRDIKGKVSIRHNGRQLDVENGNLYLSSRLVELAFPKYRSLIPEHPHWIDVERGQLLEILDRISLVADIGSVKIGVEDSSIHIDSTVDVSSGYDILAGSVNIDFKIELSINIRYTLSALRAIGGDIARIYFGTDAQPVLIRNPENETFTTLIMPIRH